jgi:hypothetical protein
LGICKICKIQIGLLVPHEVKIEWASVAFVTGICADHSESPEECWRTTSGDEPKRRQHNAISPASTLHEEVAIPCIRHRQSEIDPELLTPNAGSAIDYTIHPAICGKSCAVTLAPWIGLGGTCRYRHSFRDLNAGTLELS